MSMRDEWQERIRSDHVCACEHDDPSLIVMTQKQGPQHISVRFWDEEYSHERMQLTEILLDGVAVEGVFEAILGEEGTIWRYRGVPGLAGSGRHRCLTCQKGVCQEKLMGRVELLAKARTEEALP